MGKSVLVTGANSGIGLVTCLELAGAGWDVIGTTRSSAKAKTIRAAAKERGVEVRTVLCDVDDEASCAAAVKEVEDLTDGLHALVNNAGYAQSGAVEDVTDAQVRAQLETNVVAPIRLARLVLPGMRERGDGRIINVSSVAGRLSTPLMGWYCASKHALEAVTDALRMEVEGDGVKVSLVEPGMFGTDIWSAAKEGGFPDKPATARYAAAYARGQALGGRSDKLPDPVWVARTIRVALSNPVPLARYVVGADAVGGILAETVLPTVVTDYVKAITSGLRSPIRLPFLSATYREVLRVPLSWTLGTLALTLLAAAELGASFESWVAVVPPVVVVVVLLAAVLAQSRQRVVVEGDVLHVPRARAPLSAFGPAEVLGPDDLRNWLGPRAHRDAWVVMRPWLRGAVRLPLTDPEDDTPYWIVGSRDPVGLAVALTPATRE